MSAVEKLLSQAQDHCQKEQYEEALILYAQIDEMKNHSPDLQIAHLQGKAECHMALKRYLKARQLFEELLNKGRKRNNRYNQVEALHNIAKIDALTGKYEDAIKNLRRELNVWCSLMEGYFTGLSNNFYAQGNILYKMGNPNDARMYWLHAYTFADTQKDYFAEGQSLFALAKSSLKMKKTVEAKEYFEKSILAYAKGEYEAEIEVVEAEIAKLD